MAVDIDQKHQVKVEAGANILCQLKQRYHTNKGHDFLDITAVEEVLYMPSYPLL